MPRKIKVVDLRSRNFKLLILKGGEEWYVRNTLTLAATQASGDMSAYRELKRIWRKSKEDFESACRFMDYDNLFSKAGVKL